MQTRLLSFLKNRSIISNKQHGICKGKSTNTAIAEFIKRVYKSVDKMEISIGLFLDLSKALDLVDHDIVACFANAGWMTFRKLKERGCDRSGTLRRVLPPLPYPSLQSHYVLDDVTRFLACPMTALIGETDGCGVRVRSKCVSSSQLLAGQ
jgi:hypothetical protein